MKQTIRLNIRLKSNETEILRFCRKLRTKYALIRKNRQMPGLTFLKSGGTWIQRISHIHRMETVHNNYQLLFPTLLNVHLQKVMKAPWTPNFHARFSNQLSASGILSIPGTVNIQFLTSLNRFGSDNSFLKALQRLIHLNHFVSYYQKRTKTNGLAEVSGVDIDFEKINSDPGRKLIIPRQFEPGYQLNNPAPLFFSPRQILFRQLIESSAVIRMNLKSRFVKEIILRRPHSARKLNQPVMQVSQEKQRVSGTIMSSELDLEMPLSVDYPNPRLNRMIMPSRKPAKPSRVKTLAGSESTVIPSLLRKKAGLFGMIPSNVDSGTPLSLDPSNPSQNRISRAMTPAKFIQAETPSNRYQQSQEENLLHVPTPYSGRSLILRKNTQQEKPEQETTHAKIEGKTSIDKYSSLIEVEMPKPPLQSTEISHIADKVYKILEKKLYIEKERRGLLKW